MNGGNEVFENVVASLVDMASIMVAYSIGISQANFILGLAYGIFDAVIVVWMRKPISGAIHRLFVAALGPTIPKDAYNSAGP